MATYCCMRFRFRGARSNSEGKCRRAQLEAPCDRSLRGFRARLPSCHQVEYKERDKVRRRKRRDVGFHEEEERTPPRFFSYCLEIECVSDFDVVIVSLVALHSSVIPLTTAFSSQVLPMNVCIHNNFFLCAAEMDACVISSFLYIPSARGETPTV